MIERLDGLPDGVLGLRARGKVTKEDYERVVEPLLEAARSEGRRLQLLLHFGPDFDGYTPAAAWEDMKVGLRYLRLFERCAVVSDEDWIRGITRAVGVVMPATVRVFRDEQLEEAISWLRSPHGGPALRHYLASDQGVLVLEPRRRLRPEDFDAAAAVVDLWIESENRLRGIVVHATEFPGWDSLSGFLRHVRFVRNHHRKIQRVALAADGRFAELVPRLVEHFVAAEVRSFAHHELDEAIAWAGGEGEEGAPRAARIGQVPGQGARPGDRPRRV